jgi:hypothetical protein
MLTALHCPVDRKPPTMHNACARAVRGRTQQLFENSVGDAKDDAGAGPAAVVDYDQGSPYRHSVYKPPAGQITRNAGANGA